MFYGIASTKTKNKGPRSSCPGDLDPADWKAWHFRLSHAAAIHMSIEHKLGIPRNRASKGTIIEALMRNKIPMPSPTEVNDVADDEDDELVAARMNERQKIHPDLLKTALAMLVPLNFIANSARS